jgi:predicted aconitase with swiveling domain
VAEQLRRDDEIGLAAHECGRERMPEHVGGHVLVEPGLCGDVGDHVVGAFGAQAPTALVEEQRRALIGSGPVLAFALPVLEGLAELVVDRHVADAVALAEDPQHSFADG